MQMAEAKTIAITVASIGAAATVIAALIGVYGNKGSHESSTAPSTTHAPSATATRTPVGTVRVPKPAAFAWVYEAPVSNPGVGHVGQISDGQRVQIVCTVQGPAFTTPYATSTLWNKIKFGAGYGYISDATVDTGSVAAVAPQC
jgi:hypothetical protein